MLSLILLASHFAAPVWIVPIIVGVCVFFTYFVLSKTSENGFFQQKFMNNQKQYENKVNELEDISGLSVYELFRL